MALVSRACDLFWSCFAWSSDDETEQIVQNESVPPINTAGISQTGVIDGDAAVSTYEERINSLEEAIRRLSAENEALRAKQVETNDNVQTLQENLVRERHRIDKQGSQIESVNAQIRYTEPRDFVAYDGSQSSSSNQHQLRQRPTIEATYSPNYRGEEQDFSP